EVDLGRVPGGWAGRGRADASQSRAGLRPGEGLPVRRGGPGGAADRSAVDRPAVVDRRSVSGDRAALLLALPDLLELDLGPRAGGLRGIRLPAREARPLGQRRHGLAALARDAGRTRASGERIAPLALPLSRRR